MGGPVTDDNSLFNTFNDNFIVTIMQHTELLLPLGALGVLVSECCSLRPRGRDRPLEAGIMSVVVRGLGGIVDSTNSNLVLGKIDNF